MSLLKIVSFLVPFTHRAPEVFDVKHSNGPRYGYAADCWSLGVTLYVILSGTHPFTPNYATEDEKTMRLKMRRYVLRAFILCNPHSETVRNLDFPSFISTIHNHDLILTHGPLHLLHVLIYSEVEFPPKYWSGISVEARVLIRFLLTIDPKKRWTAEDVLESQWIQKDVAWLRTKYRENVLQHWLKSCRGLDRIARPCQQEEAVYLNPGVKRLQNLVEQQQQAESGKIVCQFYI